MGAAQLELGAPERAAADEGDAKATPDAPVTWDYVTLGDSLAAGVGAERGYGDRYADLFMPQASYEEFFAAA